LLLFTIFWGTDEFPPTIYPPALDNAEDEFFSLILDTALLYPPILDYSMLFYPLSFDLIGICLAMLD